MKRRMFLTAGLGTLAGRHAGAAGGPTDAPALLRAGGVVVALRHALAPGTFDPPGFRLDDCATQRNLSEDGRAQARRIGAWFRRQNLIPARVRSSPWCRCLDTARLAFDQPETWAALGSPRGAVEATNEAHLGELRRALSAASARPGFEVWVTHMFVLQALAGAPTASGEALLLRADALDRPTVLARLATE